MLKLNLVQRPWWKISYFPQWQSSKALELAGIKHGAIFSQVTANTMVVGDFRYGTIYELEDTTVEMGWINDQFIKNSFTILAEARFGTAYQNR